MKGRISLLAFLALILFTANAYASLTPTLPPASYPVAGESLLNYILGESTYTAYVDWIVERRDDVYLYLYQLENWIDGEGPIDSFFIQPTGAISEYGWAESSEGVKIDLDSELSGLIDFDKDHNSSTSNYPNLTGEHKPSDEYIAPIASASLASVAGGYKIQWNFQSGYGLYSGDESDVMWLASTLPPAYSPGYATYGNFTLNGQVPAPIIPEPTSMLLLGLGLFGFVGRAVKKRFKT